MCCFDDDELLDLCEDDWMMLDLGIMILDVLVLVLDLWCRSGDGFDLCMIVVCIDLLYIVCWVGVLCCVIDVG